MTAFPFRRFSIWVLPCASANAGAGTHGRAFFMGQKRPVVERFWSKVGKNGPVPPHMPGLGRCWIWKAAIGAQGYGVIGTGPHEIETAHRVSWKINNGEIPTGLWVLHRCDTRSCVRPSHLWVGTPRENSLDCKAKGRNPQLIPRTHCPKGHPLSGPNLRVYINPKYAPNRSCRACQKVRGAKFYRLHGHYKGER